MRREDRHDRRCKRSDRQAYSQTHSRSKTVAKPWPTPTQSDARPRAAPVRAIWWISVVAKAGAAATKRVADRNRAAVDVQFCAVDAQLALVGEGLRGERLVQLEQVDAVERRLDVPGTRYSGRRREPTARRSRRPTSRADLRRCSITSTTKVA